MFRHVARLGGAARQARALSTTPAAREELAKAPIQLFGITGRYAHALFSAASKNKALDTVEKELLAVKARAESDQAFSGFLANPVLSRKEKTEAVEAMMMNKKYSDLTKNFFGALAENNRLGMSTDVIDAFETLMTAHRGEVTCKITSAEPLDAATTKKLGEALKGFVSKGQTLKISSEVNPAIVGGLIVDVGDKHIDMSIATKVQKYTALLKESL